MYWATNDQSMAVVSLRRSLVLSVSTAVAYRGWSLHSRREAYMPAGTVCLAFASNSITESTRAL
jgi:hypothetical protein